MVSWRLTHGKISGEITSQFKEKDGKLYGIFNDKLIYLGDGTGADGGYW